MTRALPAVNGPTELKGPPLRSIPRYSVDDMDRMAERFMRSGLFGLTAPQAFTLMCLAQARGIDAMEALAQYDIVDGKPAMKAVAMQAHYQAGGGRMILVERSRQCCRIEAWHPALHPQHVVFEVHLKDLVDSKVAQRFDKDTKRWVIKETYVRFPDDMLHKRCIAKVVRAIAPGLVAGIYTPEEIRDFFDTRESTPRGVPSPARASRSLGAPPPSGAPSSPPEPLRGAADDDGGWRDFIRREVRGASVEFEDQCRAAGKADAPPLELNGHQVVNHLVTMWIDEGLAEAESVAGPDGRRDRVKAAQAVATAFRDFPREVRNDIRDYVAGKLHLALGAAGLLPEVPAEDIAPDEPEGDAEGPSPAASVTDEDGKDGTT